MNKITIKKIRPIFIIAFWCWIFFADKSLDLDLKPSEEVISFGLSAILFLIAALFFQIKESIYIKEDSLFIDLHKQQSQIKISAIKTISPKDCWNVINIETSDANLLFEVGNFNVKEVEKYFIENELYDAESTEQGNTAHNK